MLHRRNLMFVLPALMVCNTLCAADSEKGKRSIPELVAQLGHEEHGKRVEATEALMKLGEKAKPHLEKTAAATQDPEIRNRVQQLLKKIALGKAWETLTEEERGIAKPLYKESSSQNQLSIHARGNGTFTVIDAGLMRLAIRDQPYNGSATMSLSFRGGGTSSSRAGSLSVVSSRGVARGTFRGIKFTITASEFKIDGQSIKMDGRKRVVFVSKKGKLEKQVALPKPIATTAEKK